MRICLSVIALCALSSAVFAAPPQTVSARGKVIALLSAIETVPSRAELLRTDPGAEQTLHDIVKHPDRLRLARNRALSVLRYFPSPATVAVLRGVITTTSKHTKAGVELLDLQQALPSFAVVTGKTGLATVRPLLGHKHVDVRIAAAHAARLTKSPGAITLLDYRLTVEKSPMVRHGVKKSLALIRHPR